MGRRATVLIPGLCLTFSLLASGGEVTVRESRELRELFAARVDTIVIRLEPGMYDLTAIDAIDSACGNCEDSATLVPCTIGLHIRGNFVRLTGPEDRSAVIRTNAGYGLFFDRCDSAVIENLTITGGSRDTSGLATDAAIVVKNSRVLIRSNRIVDNIGDSALVMQHVVGIMGIAGRENARMTVIGNEIVRNSWDGIALYRGAEAVIEGNVIDGVEKARGNFVGGGRGVGIGVTWNGRATIRGNLVKRYWKGIGLFVDASGIVENNVVEDIITWGIALWDAGKGAPEGFIRRNIIYNTGACGVSLARSEEGAAPGELVDNVIVETGQNPKYDSPDYYCEQCALAISAVPAYFRIDGNVFHNNRRATEDLPDRDMDPREFMQFIRKICHSLTENPVLQDAGFVRDFCYSR